MNRKEISAFIILSLLLAGMGLRLHVLHRQADPDAESPFTADPERMEDARLFNSLLKENLIRPDDRGRLFLPPSDLILVKKAKHSFEPRQHPLDPEQLKEEEKLIRDLYHTPPGHAVRTQVRLWNETRLLAAVRDNRPKPRGNIANLWRAGETGHPEGEIIQTGPRVPEHFGYVNNGVLRPNFCDWMAAYTDAETVEFRTEVLSESADTSLIVQIVGIPNFESISPKLKKENIIPCFSPRIEIKDRKNPPDAYLLKFRLKKGTNPLSIPVRSIWNQEKKVEGYSIRQNKDGFEWLAKKPAGAKPVRRPVRILTADGEALTDRDGNVTDLCHKLGLLPLAGMGDLTPYALWGLLSRSFIPGDMTDVMLTIDSRYQKIAQDALEKQATEFWKDVKDDYADERKGAVVLLETETGAVLAAAGYPLPPSNIHPWDIASFAKLYYVKNPLLVRAWQGLDRHFTPGSTFKPVTALAAMEEAGENPIITDFLEGVPASGFEKRTGLSRNCRAYAPIAAKCVPPGTLKSIPNFQNASISNAFQKNRFGLKQAVRSSVNVWFVRLAMLTDGDRIGHTDSAPLSDVQLVRTARKLGFGEMPPDLAVNAPDAVKLKRRIPVIGKGGREGDVLFGNTGAPDLLYAEKESPEIQKWILAQNSIGQGVIASPLQMARAAASVRSGKSVSPFLIKQWGKEKVSLQKFEELGIPEKHMDILRQGMKNVPETGGTAAPGFKDHPELRPDVWGKTGTANIAESKKSGYKSQKKFVTTWFMGWHEPGNIAFACMITHAHGSKKDTGGRVCAPVIADILHQITAGDEAVK